ncbi:Deoxyuridine 5'-triphosphate nucleotidohydrolase [Sinorhizobium sojae CCBAU 05684]|uniref:Deoxyuridine 5'-triphosphate nucleotidohydrolase n=2 Tax=Sinorhizobium sojae TaxID=716925 RepID=A0A249PH25_9HYPH|nr:Deoxyuridine 5'-triphosphate nucleotidohydrolase [Sinorhizobium sojae CCBAU 05684]
MIEYPVSCGVLYRLGGQYAIDWSGAHRPYDGMTMSTPENHPALTLVRLSHAAGLDLPAYETAGAAGMDLRAAVPAEAPMTIPPGGRDLVPTGFIFEFPAGYEGQVRPRSGLAFKHGITCLNTPGTIDSDYRGEVKVLLVNLGGKDFVVERGMRIAQMVVAPVVQATVREADGASATARGAGGFGSTGAK